MIDNSDFLVALILCAMLGAYIIVTARPKKSG